MIFLVGIVVLVIGVVALFFPDTFRSTRRFSNEWEGVETRQGTAFEANRVITGVVALIAGIITLIVGFMSLG